MRADVHTAERVRTLIHAASAIAGSQNKLAKSIGYSSSEVSEWATGSRACPLEAQVLMAHLAGFNPQEVLAHAMIERHANTPRGEKLFTALGKASRQAGAVRVALAAIFASVVLAFSVPTPAFATSYDV